jgi:hypothetical protein
MNIIFGKDVADELRNKHTVLELDTITIRGSGPIIVYCIIEHIPLDELPKAEGLKELHAALMENYRNQNWGFCVDAIEQLMGAWNSEADTFYENLLERVIQYQAENPGPDWTYIIAKE